MPLLIIIIASVYAYHYISKWRKNRKAKKNAEKHEAEPDKNAEEVNNNQEKDEGKAATNFESKV